MVRTALLTLSIFLLSAPLALAADDGQGTYGPADDKVVTNAGFILIGGIPLLLMLLSLLQGGLEKRKYRRLKAAKARKARADQRGGGEPPSGAAPPPCSRSTRPRAPKPSTARQPTRRGRRSRASPQT